MKINKSTLIVIAVNIIVFNIVVFINFNRNNNKKNVLSLSLANIEALAQESLNTQWYTCYETISNSGNGNQTHVTYCGDCSPKLARSWSGKSSCSK
jgi:hypothetical protein